MTDQFSNDAPSRCSDKRFLGKNKLAPMELREVMGAARDRALRIGIPHQWPPLRITHVEATFRLH